MSKKLVEQINNERDRFLRRAAEKGLPPDQTDNLFDLISKFANYGFNKSHAAAYAVVTYRTAYVKANYPAEFFAALLNSRADAATHVQECRLNCQALGVRLLGPDVNQSAAGFSVEREPDGGRPAIRYGLEAIRNVGPSAAKALLDERTANGPFRSIDEFCRRVRTRAVTRRTLESLVKAGACDCFGLPRQRLCLVVDDICARWERSGESALQRSFFDDFNDAAAPRDTVRIELDAVAEWEPLTRLLFEKEALGIYLSGHPLETYRAFWRAATTADARNTGFIREPDGGEGELLESPPAAVLMGGLVLSADWRMSRRGKSYGILTIEDFYGAFEALVWSDLVEQWRGRITPNQILFVRGTLRESFGRTALSVSALAEAPDAMAGWVDVLQLNIPRAHASAAALARVADVVKAHPGDTPVELCLPGTDPATPVRRIEARTRVTVTEALLAGLMELLGDDAVRCLVRI
jgi:DNA polymerase-3 subunit alpha